MKTDYFVQVTGWILGEHRTKHSVVQATPEEAKYALLSGSIALEKAPTNEEQREITAQANAPADEPDQVDVVEDPPVEIVENKSKK